VFNDKVLIGDGQLYPIAGQVSCDDARNEGRWWLSFIYYTIKGLNQIHPKSQDTYTFSGCSKLDLLARYCKQNFKAQNSQVPDLSNRATATPSIPKFNRERERAMQVLFRVVVMVVVGCA